VLRGKFHGALEAGANEVVKRAQTGIAAPGVL